MDLKEDISVKSCESNRTGRTDHKLAKIAGVSEKTIYNTETILTKGTKEDIQEVREGKSSISGKAKEIKQREVQPVVKRPQAEDSNLKLILEVFYIRVI